MTAVDPNFATDAAREARRAVWFTRINKADKWFTVLGLSWLTPMLKAAAGDNPKAQMGEIWRLLGVPLLAEVPLDLQIRLASDGGAPITVSQPDGPQAAVAKLGQIASDGLGCHGELA